MLSCFTSDPCEGVIIVGQGSQTNLSPLYVMNLRPGSTLQLYSNIKVQIHWSVDSDLCKRLTRILALNEPEWNMCKCSSVLWINRVWDYGGPLSEMISDFPN